MNFKEIFLKLTEYTIPFGYEKELEPLLPKGWSKDSIGNYYYIIGKSETLFTAHLDVATDKREKVNHIIDGNIIKTDGTTILGGDNKAGCCVLFYLIENKVPGTYYFFLGEESAVHKNYPHGSMLAIEKDPNFFKKFKRAIAFDRKKTGELITRQLGYNCCSDEFAESLISEFLKSGIKYVKDNTGSYTDTAFFGSLISEITNISVGVWNEHSTSEYVDISYVERVAIASSKIDWESLPSIREIGNTEIDPRSDVEMISSKTSDQKIFEQVFFILDNLYYVCREIRSYNNFLYYFRSGREYHFTEWHGDGSLVLSIERGKIFVDDKEYDNILDFKRSLGMDELSPDKFADMMLIQFLKNKKKLSTYEFSQLLFMKGGEFKKVNVDLKKRGWKLTKVGKEYQIIKESINKTYEEFKFLKDLKKKINQSISPKGLNIPIEEFGDLLLEYTDEGIFFEIEQFNNDIRYVHGSPSITDGRESEGKYVFNEDVGNISEILYDKIYCLHIHPTNNNSYIGPQFLPHIRHSSTNIEHISYIKSLILKSNLISDFVQNLSKRIERFYVGINVIEINSFNNADRHISNMDIGYDGFIHLSHYKFCIPSFRIVFYNGSTDNT